MNCYCASLSIPFRCYQCFKFFYFFTSRSTKMYFFLVAGVCRKTGPPSKCWLLSCKLQNSTHTVNFRDILQTDLCSDPILIYSCTAIFLVSTVILDSFSIQQLPSCRHSMGDLRSLLSKKIDLHPYKYVSKKYESGKFFIYNRQINFYSLKLTAPKFISLETCRMIATFCCNLSFSSIFLKYLNAES